MTSALLLLVAALPACGGDDAPPPQDDLTQIVLSIETDLAAPEEIDMIGLVVVTDAGEVRTLDEPVDDTTALPLTFGLLRAEGADPGDLVVAVTGYLVGEPVIEYAVKTQFLDGESRLLTLPLADRCLGVLCAVDVTCDPDSGGCVPIAMSIASEPRFEGVVPDPEICNTVDDDGDGAADEITDLLHDDAHCGACDAGCPQDQICVEGACAGGAIVSVSAGGYHTCALRDTGVVTCWGYAEQGQIGDPALAGVISRRARSRSAPDLVDVTAIRAGLVHTCALRAGGTVSCFGDNSFGQLGDGTLLSTVYPVSVTDLVDVVALDTDFWHTCAARSNGTAACWGNNASGQLGDGATAEREPRPVEVVGLADATGIDVGQDHTCALRVTGAVSCWGDDRDGQLGASSARTDPRLPADVDGITDAIQITAGRTHSCALHAGGTVSCWGGNRSGQLGAGPVGDTSATPVLVDGLMGVLSVDAGAASEPFEGLPQGGDHTCAVLTSGAVRCWGANDEGQLGTGDFEGRDRPSVPVLGVSGAAAVSAGALHSCVVAGEQVVCFGHAVDGQLGDWTLYVGAVSTPVVVLRP